MEGKLLEQYGKALGTKPVYANRALQNDEFVFFNIPSNDYKVLGRLIYSQDRYVNFQVCLVNLPTGRTGKWLNIGYLKPSFRKTEIDLKFIPDNNTAIIAGVKRNVIDVLIGWIGLDKTILEILLERLDRSKVKPLITSRSKRKAKQQAKLDPENTARQGKARHKPKLNLDNKPLTIEDRETIRKRIKAYTGANGKTTMTFAGARQ